MTRNPNNLEHEKLRMQKEGLKEQQSEGSFFGIPLISSKGDEGEQSNSFSIGFGIQNSKDSSQIFFGNQSDNITQFSIGDSKLDSLNPAVKSMIYQLELSIKSGKIDQQAIDIFQQLSQLIPTNLISNYSSIIDNSSIEKIKQLSNTSTTNQQSDPKLIDQNQNSESTELTNQEKQYLSDFYGNIRENSNQAVKSLENDIQDNFKDITKNHSNLNQTN